MKKQIIASLALGAMTLAATMVQAETSIPLDPHHTSATFSISHLTLTKVTGQVPLIKSEVTLGKNELPTMVDATLDAEKLETQDDNRDKDLRSEKWFNTAKYPTITFHSTAVTPKGSNEFVMAGELTMHGITKPVTLTGTYNGMAKDPMGHIHLGYSATGKIDRTEFSIGQAPAAIVGNEVTINLEVEALRIDTKVSKK
jgi:polyisoprenoid-binding protein YceI